MLNREIQGVNRKSTLIRTCTHRLDVSGWRRSCLYAVRRRMAKPTWPREPKRPDTIGRRTGGKAPLAGAQFSAGRPGFWHSAYRVSRFWIHGSRPAGTGIAPSFNWSEGHFGGVAVPSPSPSSSSGAAWPPERTSRAIGRPWSPSHPATRSLRRRLGHAGSTVRFSGFASHLRFVGGARDSGPLKPSLR